MKLSMLLTNYAGDSHASVNLVRDLESAGLDIVWVPEAYGFDAMTFVGYLSAVTSRIQIGTGIVNTFSRTPTLLAMSAAGADALSGGRFLLGLGASGPQVIEGFHGLPYQTPLTRMRETIDICRQVWRREEPLIHSGKVFSMPLTGPGSTGLGKPLKIINHPLRPRIPIYWASLLPKSVEATAEMADGWLPFFYMPEGADAVFGPALKAGVQRRAPDLAPLEIVAGGPVAIGDDLPVDDLLDRARPLMARYVGGMGARGKNFYNDLARRYGYEREATLVQDLYLDGHVQEAAAAIPRDWLAATSLIGSQEQVRERIEVYRAAGVTILNIDPIGPDPVRTVETLATLAT